jgi:cell division septal protein FtsQ
MFKKQRRQPRYKINYRKSPSYKRGVTKKNYAERFFKKTKQKGKKWSTPFKITLAILAFIIGLYFIFISNLFLINDIRFLNESFENENFNQEIENTISSFISENLFLIDTEEITSQIIMNFPQIEEVTVNKNYPHTITIEFTKYPLVANVINESTNIKKNYIINSIGYAIKEDLENQNLPYVYIETDEPVNTNIPVIEEAKLNYILNSIKYFEEKFGMRIVEVEYKKIARELHLLTEKDFYIWLDIQVPAEEQLKKLKKALVKLDIYKENLQYIDLRIAGESGDKIIYKRK